MGSRSGTPPSRRSARKRTICSGMVASASIRAARSGAASSASAASSPRTPASTLERSSSTRGWSNQRNRMLRARSPTTGKRSWVACTSRSRTWRTCHGQAVGRRRLRDPALEQAGDEVDVGTGTPLGQEDPEDRLLQLAGAVQVGHAVAGEHRGEALPELLVQPVPLHVEALQVGVEVLLGAVHAELGVQLLPGGAVATELGQVGEQVEQLDLAADHVAAGLAGLLPGVQVARQGRGLGVGVGVVAQHDRAQRDEALGGALGRRGLGRGLRQLEVRAGQGGGVGGGLVLVRNGLDPQQRRPGLHLAPGLHEELAHPSGEGGVEHGLHLHALQHEHLAAGGDEISHGERGRHHQGGGRRAEHAALVAGDPVGDPVHLHELHGPVGGGHQSEALPTRRSAGCGTRRWARSPRPRRGWSRRRRS